MFCKFWLDNGVCETMFMGVRLLVEEMVDTISVTKGCGSKVIGKS